MEESEVKQALYDAYNDPSRQFGLLASDSGMLSPFLHAHCHAIIVFVIVIVIIVIIVILLLLLLIIIIIIIIITSIC